MVINEFRWVIEPPIPARWRSTRMHDGFEIEVAAGYVEARAADDGDERGQQRRAGVIVGAIARSIGLNEKTAFRATLGSRSRFYPQSGRRDATVFFPAVKLKTRVEPLDFVVTSEDGAVASDTREQRLAQMYDLADALARNANLQRMGDYLVDYHCGDPRKLAPLYDIIELANGIFGGRENAARSLGISPRRLKEAARIMNNSRIRSGRHRGGEVGEQRGPTPKEVRACEKVAEQIVAGCIKLVLGGRLGL